MSNKNIGTTMPDGTRYAGISPTTGRPMYAACIPALADNFESAAAIVARLKAHGHNDWRLADAAEIKVIFDHAAALGLRTDRPWPNNWYWANHTAGNKTWAESLDTRAAGFCFKTREFSLLCIRG